MSDAPAAAPTAPAPPQPAQAALAGGELALVSLALALGTFMQVLDTTIANVSIPTIAGNLGVATNQGTWVITSFAVANGVSVPLTGWLMQRYGVVRTFVVSVLLFTAASFLCGAAWSLPSLIMFRVLQGAVSGPMIPGSQALLLSVFPPEKKGVALSIWGMTTLVAPIFGPICGGYISDNYTWPWIFLINLPVGLFCAAVCWRILKSRETPTRQLPIDTTGIALMVLWIGALQIMLDRGKELDWFQSIEIISLTVVAVVGFIAFIVWELGEKHPIVDLSLFRNRNFTFGSIALSGGYGVFLGSVVLTPLWLQTQLGYTATWAGLVAAPTGIIAVLISPPVGRLIAKVDGRLVATFSFLAFAASYFMRAGLHADASYAAFVVPQLVFGLGAGTFFVSMVSITLHGTAPQRMPAATGMSNFLRITAGSFATSLTTTLWERRASLHQTRLAEATSIYDPSLQQTFAQLHSYGLSDPQATGALTRTLINQSFALSTLDFFWGSAWLTLSLIVLIWLCARPTGAVAAGGD